MVPILLASVTVALAASAVDPSREQVVKIVTQIQRADYEGDRAELKRLYGELTPFVEDKVLASRVRYWRGFALWRRALNGFNESVDPKELQEDLEQAVSEFDHSYSIDPSFVDAKVGAGSCLSNLIFLKQKNAARVQELVSKAGPLLKQAEAEAPENPRLLWVLGPNRWYAPPERGGSQAKAIEIYEKGLKAVRKHQTTANDALEPSWGEPELLMNLAWSNLHRTTPDLAVAEADARSALKLVPYWHYVRDILMPQIQSAIDVAGIQKLRDQDIAASKSGDFETLNTLFTEDAVVMPPASDFVRGRQQRVTNLAKVREATSQYRVFEYREDFEELKIYGNEAVEWGTISGKMQDTRTGKVETSAYKVMRMLRKQPSGEWKIARSIYNDIPPKVQK